MNKLLFLLLFILLLAIGKKRGAKTFFTFLICMLLIVIYIVFMRFGFNAILMAFIITIFASLISLFFLNGYSIKTKAAFISVMLVQVVAFILIYIVTKSASIGAFGEESLEVIAGFNYDINYNMNDVLIGMYLVSIVGTVIDTSISVSTAMNEVYENNPKLKEKELLKSGLNIGGDILSTTINTLYFALISGFIGFSMWHRGMPLEQMINYKLFVKALIQSLTAFIASVLIIPVTAYITSKMLVNKNFIFESKK